MCSKIDMTQRFRINQIMVFGSLELATLNNIVTVFKTIFSSIPCKYYYSDKSKIIKGLRFHSKTVLLVLKYNF